MLKAAPIIALLFLGGLEATPQGQIVFNNRVGGLVVAPVYGPEPANPELHKQGNTSAGTPSGTQTYSGTPLQGPGYTAQLFAGPTNAAVSNLQAVTPPAPFSNVGLGFIEPPDFAVTIPGVPEGTRARIQLRVWENDNGELKNWDQVRSNGWVPRGESLAFVTPPLGGSVTLPPNLVGLESFNIAVPLGAAGAVPARPLNLMAMTVSDTQIDLSWQDTATNETGFRIQRSLDGLRFGTIASAPAGATSFASAGLRPNTRYYYRVRAFNGTAESAFSNTNFASTRTPFSQWQMENFSGSQLTNAAVAGPNGDPEGDGLPNVLEHAFGRLPFQGDSQSLGQGILQSIEGAEYLALLYTRRKLVVDVAFQASASTNLTLWESVTNLIGPSIVAETATTVTETIRHPAPVTVAPKRFLKLGATHTGVRDSWETNTPMPVALDEVACAVIGRRLYVVGGGSPVTLAFDLETGHWTNLNVTRPFPGNHHAAEAFNGRLYLFGGLGASSEGRVQIYDPALNSWSSGPPMPFVAGSCASAVISNQIYVAGGLGEQLATNVARFTPASNSWTTLAPMPFVRNHTASGTDGSLFYVFGGRGAGNTLANGSDTVQIYNPAGNTWASSASPGSLIEPLPQPRGGMGKAVFLNGEFYIMGGETATGAGATAQRVYNRVDIYNTTSYTWREGAPMLTARHGIYPVLDDIRIYVSGGGVLAGASSSALLETYITP